MFKIVNYILIKDCIKKRSIDIGQVNKNIKTHITDIEKKEEMLFNKHYTLNDNLGNFFYIRNDNLLYLIYSNSELIGNKAFQIIEKIISNELGTALLNSKDEDNTETVLHYIYNIVDTIVDENMDEYCNLRLNDTSQIFYVNKYREALLTYGDSARASFRTGGIGKIKLIIILVSISIIILLAIILPLII